MNIVGRLIVLALCLACLAASAYTYFVLEFSVLLPVILFCGGIGFAGELAMDIRRAFDERSKNRLHEDKKIDSLLHSYYREERKKKGAAS